MYDWGCFIILNQNMMVEFFFFVFYYLKREVMRGEEEIQETR